MQRAKRRTHPPLPRTAEECAAILQGGGAGATSFNTHLQAVVQWEDEESGKVEVALIFYEQSIGELLPLIKDVNFDATFHTVPGLFYQLWNILGHHGNYSFPLVHVLMTCKKATLYHKVVQKVKELVPNFSPEKAMGDFESSPGEAFKAAFPDCEIGGCHFHFSQSLFRKIQKLGLTDEFSANSDFKKFIKKVMSLPYLPSHDITAAAESLFEQAAALPLSPDAATKVQKFKLYFFRQWIRKVTPEKFSVFNFERGTNNDAEAFHSRLKAIIRTHKPNLYSFLAQLNNLMTDTKNDIIRADSGLQVTRRRKQKFVQNLERRNVCKEKYTGGTYNVSQFLNAVMYTLDPSLIAEAHQNSSDDEEGEEEDPAAAADPPPAPDVPPELQCAVCLARRDRTVVLLPCWHGQFCPSCIETIIQNSSAEEPAKCPVCRTNIVDRHEVF